MSPAQLPESDHSSCVILAMTENKSMDALCIENLIGFFVCVGLHNSSSGECWMLAVGSLAVLAWRIPRGGGAESYCIRKEDVTVALKIGKEPCQKNILTLSSLF